LIEGLPSRGEDHRVANERVRVLYSGTVQGVGFRWRVVDSASGRAVTGFVANLQDGRVELVAEGERAELETFLAAVRARMTDLIAAEDAAWSAATGEFREFGVRR
jgi:acylphosphatase